MASIPKIRFLRATVSPTRGSGDRPINPGAALGTRPPGPAPPFRPGAARQASRQWAAAAEGFDGRAERQIVKEDTMAINARVGIIGGNGWLGNAIAQAAVATG